MQLPYYGAGQNIPAVNAIYPGITTPDELYLALCKVWSRDTCSLTLREHWSEENRTCGQCSITAMLAQDIFGGEVYGMHLSNGAVHCYNVVGGKCFDLASEQFGESAAKLRYEDNPLISRTEQHSDDNKCARYELLKQGLREQTGR